MIHLRLGTPLGIIRASSSPTLWLLPRQWGADPLAGSVILWTFYEEGGDAFSEGVGEPDDLGFFEAGGGWWLEEEGGDGVAHGLVYGE